LWPDTVEAGWLGRVSRRLRPELLAAYADAPGLDLPGTTSGWGIPLLLDSGWFLPENGWPRLGLSLRYARQDPELVAGGVRLLIPGWGLALGFEQDDASGLRRGTLRLQREF
jgi:hypothetical protein